MVKVDKGVLATFTRGDDIPSEAIVEVLAVVDASPPGAWASRDASKSSSVAIWYRKQQIIRKQFSFKGRPNFSFVTYKITK